MNNRKRWLLTIDRLWDGAIANASEGAAIVLSLSPTGMHVEVTARFHDDPAPARPAGQTDGLWNYEVVELFVANERGEYLELELGPHGHYLGLLFSGVREVSHSNIEVSCQATIIGSTWQATTHVDPSFLPPEPSRANAFAIHGRNEARRYLAAFPLPGTRPNFHQPRLFPRLEEIPKSATPPAS